MANGPSPFHAGERSVQSLLGVREQIDPWARRVVRSFLPEQHREFYAELPFVVAAARDSDGRPWATVIAGQPGFIQSPDDKTLQLAATTPPGDALEGTLAVGAELGLLGIDLEARRRNRVNGRVSETGDSSIKLEVGQSFGNCPQYITERPWRQVDVSTANTSASRFQKLDAEMRNRIETADTFFIASGYREDGADAPIYGMDASHRGGASGFVKVLSDKQLVFPDYAGNNHFNTIGNLVMDPRVGLLFVDFETGSLLQISGAATIDWDSADVVKHAGAQRLVVIDVERIVRLDGVLPLRWSEPGGSIRSLRLVRRQKESDDVTSFEFLARDGGDLVAFKAGQHLPIEVPVDGYDKRQKRTYSLSNRPGDGCYRISVKRRAEGIVSRYLHDSLEIGDIVSARTPAGDFVLEHGRRPAVLISAGIGVTPMISMLHALVHEKHKRPVYFFHGARDSRHHPMSGEVRRIANNHDNVQSVVAYSRPLEDDAVGIHYDRQGYVTAALVDEAMPNLNADFYVCGPTGFMADITTALEDLGVSSSRIHTESF